MATLHVDAFKDNNGTTQSVKIRNKIFLITGHLRLADPSLKISLVSSLIV